MKKYIICKIEDILGDPLISPVNQHSYDTKEEAIAKIPNEPLPPKKQYLVIYKETDKNGIIIESKIVHFT